MREGRRLFAPIAFQFHWELTLSRRAPRGLAPHRFLRASLHKFLVKTSGFVSRSRRYMPQILGAFLRHCERPKSSLEEFDPEDEPNSIDVSGPILCSRYVETCLF